MPDKRSNRGPHPKDHDLFTPPQIEAIRRAMSDYSWLLSRGYARPSSLKLIDDRHKLRKRQRVALNRVACSDDEVALRKCKCLNPEQINGATLAIDGFNLITTIEAALSGRLLITCRDGCIRDIASMHGNYRRVSQTEAAIQIAPISRRISDYCNTPALKIASSGNAVPSLPVSDSDISWPSAGPGGGTQPGCIKV